MPFNTSVSPYVSLCKHHTVALGFLLDAAVLVAPRPVLRRLMQSEYITIRHRTLCGASLGEKEGSRTFSEVVFSIDQRYNAMGMFHGLSE